MGRERKESSNSKARKSKLKRTALISAFAPYKSKSKTEKIDGPLIRIEVPLSPKNKEPRHDEGIENISGNYNSKQSSEKTVTPPLMNCKYLGPCPSYSLPFKAPLNYPLLPPLNPQGLENFSAPQTQDASKPAFTLLMNSASNFPLYEAADFPTNFFGYATLH